MTGMWWKGPIAFVAGGVLSGALVTWLSGYWLS